MDLKEAHFLALTAARSATADYIARNGDNDLCGFAWVESYEKGNTKIGRQLAELGFKKGYTKGYYLWDPSHSGTQSVSAKEAGARAYADAMKKHFPSLKLYPASRLD